MASYDTYCKIRDSKGMNDSQVAKLAGIGRSTFTDWKSGRSTPKMPKIIKIAQVLNVNPETLEPATHGYNATAFYKATETFLNESQQARSFRNNISFDLDDLKSFANIKADQNKSAIFAWLAHAPEEDVSLILSLINRFSVKEGE